MSAALLALMLGAVILQVSSGALQWVETALRACLALHAGVKGRCILALHARPNGCQVFWHFARA
jgi:hypothetical protein